MSNTSEIRSKKIRINIIITSLCKGCSLLISFLYVPLLLHSMDTANYAVWLTLTSLVSWLSIFDIGLGNGLRNRLSESLAKEDIDKGREYISTAYVSITFICGGLIVVFLFVSQFIDWNNVVNNGKSIIQDLGILVNIVSCSFICSIALNLINSIFYALQRPALVSFVALTGQLISYIAVLILVYFKITSILILGCTVSVIPPLTLLLSSIIFFNKKEKQLKPSYQYFRKYLVKDILSLSLKFLFITFSTIILYQSSNIILTHTLDAEAVVTFNISYKYMYITATLFTLICIPIWSATTEAYKKNDFSWIRNTNKRLLQISLIFTFLGVIQLVISKQVYHYWIGEDCPEISYITTALLLLYIIGLNLYASYGYILNGIGKLKVQVICTMVISITYVPLSIIFSKYWGLNGMLIIVAIVPWFNFAWSKIQYHKLLNKTAKGIWNQ